MADTKIVNISGRAKPTRRMRALATILHGDKFARSVDSMIDDAVAIDALAGAIDRALTESVTSDGRVDLKKAAAHILGEIKRAQR